MPSAPVGLADNTAVTSASIIGLKWNNGISTGGSPIIDYRVSYDQSTGTYIVLKTGVVARQFQTAVTLTAGATYNFRVEARNSVGYSILSAPVAILAPYSESYYNSLACRPIVSRITIHWHVAL